MDFFGGEPKLFLSADGANISVRSGQPVMEQGLENIALISLFTEEGWFGNQFLRIGKVGSRFVRSARAPITISSLNDVRQAGLDALRGNVFGDVSANVSNVSGQQLKVEFFITPPTGPDEQLIIERITGNWLAQARRTNA